MSEPWFTLREREVFTLAEVESYTALINMDAALANGPGRFLLTRTFTNAPMEVLPGVKSFSPAYETMMRALYEQISRDVAPSATHEGMLLGGANEADYSPLLTEPGAAMNPVGYPNVSNLADTVDFPSMPAHGRISDMIMSVFFEKWEPTTYSIPRDSSMGFPNASHAASDKLEAFYHFARQPQAWLKLVTGAPADMIAQGLVPLTFVQVRRQADKWTRSESGDLVSPKDRVALTLPEALHLVDTRSVADKTIQGSFLAAKRVRLAYAVPALLNIPIGAAFAGFAKPLPVRFPFMYHTTGPEDLAAKIGTMGEVRSVDVREFDHTVPSTFIALFFDYLATHVFDERFVRHLAQTWTQPVWAPSPVVGARGHGRLFGNPYDRSTYRIMVGLGSGIAVNSFFGKLWATVVLACGLHDVMGMFREADDIRLRDALVTWMRGEDKRVACLDMGDDVVLGCRDPKRSDALWRSLKPREGQTRADFSPYLDFEVEDYAQYLGMLPYREREGDQVKVAPRMLSYLKNTLTPERGAYSRFRPYPAIGYQARAVLYSEAPAYAEVHDMLTAAIRTHFHVEIDAVMTELAAREELQLASLNRMDLLALADPSRLHYRIDDSDLSRSVRDKLLLTIPEHDIESGVGPIVRRALGGRL